MPPSNLEIIPHRGRGGSRFGHHFLTSFHDCETKFWNSHLREHPTGGHGVETASTSPALLIGSIFHDGLEGYYRSPGWAEGHYELDSALTAAEALLDKRAHEWESPDERAKGWSLVEHMLTTYHEYWGPGGIEPEYPGLRVVDLGGGEPAVEHEFEVDMGYGGYVFTSKIDTVVEDERGLLWVLEHKTSAPSRVSALLRRCRIDGQLTGEAMALMAHFPDREVGGIIVNVAVKGAAKGKPPFIREAFGRSWSQIEKYHMDATRKLKRIDDGVGYYRELRAAGMPDDEAARVAFDGSPSGTRCVDIFRCQFYDLCLNRPISDRIVEASYRPRVMQDHNPFEKGEG